MLSVALLLLEMLVLPGLIGTFFICPSHFDFFNFFSYLRLFTHVLGHANWEHLTGNFAFILLLGPILEEKYGSWELFELLAITAFVTGLLNVIFFDTGLLGASGVVFMLIILSSWSRSDNGHIPLTFILVFLLFVGKEILNSIRDDNISQFAHIIGGLTGSGFGYLLSSNNK